MWLKPLNWRFSYQVFHWELQKKLHSNLEEHLLLIPFIFKFCSSWYFIDSFLQYYSPGCTFPYSCWKQFVPAKLSFCRSHHHICLGLTGGLCVPFYWDCGDVSLMDFQSKLLYCWQQNDHSKHPNMTCEKKKISIIIVINISFAFKWLCFLRRENCTFGGLFVWSNKHVSGCAI